MGRWPKSLKYIYIYIYYYVGDVNMMKHYQMDLVQQNVAKSALK